MDILRGYCFKCHSRQDFISQLQDGVYLGVYECKKCGEMFVIIINETVKRVEA